MVLALGLLVQAADPPKAPLPSPRLSGPPVEMRLADGSTVRMTFTQPNIELVTKYGKLTIPASEIRRVEFGFRYPEGAEAKIGELVARLGDSNFKKRETASSELLAFREMAYPALKLATKSSDAETAKRAAELVAKLEDKLLPEKLTFRQYDQIVAIDFAARGKIEAKTLQGHTPYFGEVKLELAELRTLRSVAFGGETTVQIESTKFLDAIQTEWMDADIELSGDTPIEIVASGQVSLYRGGGFGCGPKGHASYNNGTHQAGALLGRIGNSGEIFVIGEKYNGSPKGSGRLYVRLAHSPWPGQASGSYKVVITPNPLK